MELAPIAEAQPVFAYLYAKVQKYLQPYTALIKKSHVNVGVVFFFSR
jgi:hypothetical protein